MMLYSDRNVQQHAVKTNLVQQSHSTVLIKNFPDFPNRVWNSNSEFF